MGKQSKLCTSFQSPVVDAKRKKKCSDSQVKGKRGQKMEKKSSTAFVVNVDQEKSEAGERKKVEASENLNSNSKQTLQEAFLTYRKKRHEKMVGAGKAAKRKRLKRCDPKKMMALRMKFLEQCMKYIGTPYKRKYHEPGTPEYNAPLFLDCCALVRRAIQDLRNDFGFNIGPWNQSYMYDTLPTVIAKDTSMKPGDLVFISGVYFNQKMKAQVHGIVHVEVWLGEGRKTVGARWHKGTVQIFDSYRFKSTSYHSMRYHFKSINPWLMGICKSHCPLHAWRLPSDFRPSKRSVLHLRRQDGQQQQQQQQQQQNASDVDQLSKNLPRQECQKKLDRTNNNQLPGTSAAGNILELDEQQQRLHVDSAASGTSEDSQEELMKDILLSGSEMDVLAEKIRTLPISHSAAAPTCKKSLTYIQVAKSINQCQDESILAGNASASSSGGISPR